MLYRLACRFSICALVTVRLLSSQEVVAVEPARSDDARKTGQHDAILAEVARGQFSAGDSKAAIETASQIDDDRTFADTVAAIRVKKPPGAGGGVQADFEPLIDLIQATVGPT